MVLGGPCRSVMRAKRPSGVPCTETGKIHESTLTSARAKPQTRSVASGREFHFWQISRQSLPPAQHFSLLRSFEEPMRFLWFRIVMFRVEGLGLWVFWIWGSGLGFQLWRDGVDECLRSWWGSTPPGDPQIPASFGVIVGNQLHEKRNGIDCPACNQHQPTVESTFALHLHRSLVPVIK